MHPPREASTKLRAANRHARKLRAAWVYANAWESCASSDWAEVMFGCRRFSTCGFTRRLWPYIELLRGFSRAKFSFRHPEDTGPAHTQMQLQHRSRAPGPPYNSRTPISRRAGPQRLAPLGRLKRRRGPPCALAAQAARGRRLAEGLPQGAVTGTSVAQRSVATAGVLSGKTPSLSTTPSPTSSTAGPSASPQALETGSPAYRLPAACGFARAIAAPRPQQRS